MDPHVIPMLAYADGVAAMDWLQRAFGFRERTRMTDDTGRLEHGELAVGDAVVMLATPSPHYEGPARHREHCAESARWQEVPYIVDGLLVYVDDVREHAARARESGARILTDVDSDEHGTRYRAEDLEGHRWMFMQR